MGPFVRLLRAIGAAIVLIGALAGMTYSAYWVANYFVPSDPPLAFLAVVFFEIAVLIFYVFD